jgi:hypothetical protein
MAVQQSHDDHGGDDADQDEKPALPAAGVGQKAECRAGVVHQDKRKEWQHRHRFLEVEAEKSTICEMVVTMTAKATQAICALQGQYLKAWLRARLAENCGRSAQAGVIDVCIDVVAVSQQRSHFFAMLGVTSMRSDSAATTAPAT